MKTLLLIVKYLSATVLAGVVTALFAIVGYDLVSLIEPVPFYTLLPLLVGAYYQFTFIFGRVVAYWERVRERTETGAEAQCCEPTAKE